MSNLSVIPKHAPAPADDRTRRVFLVIRRALLMIAAAIAREFGTED